MADKKKIKELLTRGVSEVIDFSHLEKQLLSGKKLRVKLGIDPTSSRIHLGRAVSLLKLKDFQDLGCQIVFIIGDFTGTIGDTSDKDSERPMLSEKEVRKNMKSYTEQAARILDIKKAEVRFNSDWLAKLGYSEIGKQANQFSLAEFAARENVKKRLNSGKRVSLKEILYPLMQGYDSVAVKADVEIGGTDQRFNLLAGRAIQQLYKMEPQDILMTNLIPGTDGRKMSSSWGNTINIEDKPENVFGKVMSLPDSLICSYFEHCTRVPMAEVKDYEKQLKGKKVNPRDLKMKLAFEITKICSSRQEALKAQKLFVDVFQKKKAPGQVPSMKLAGKEIAEVLVAGRLAKSKSEARRLISEKAVRIDGRTVLSLEEKVKKGSLVQKGKRYFLKIS